MAELADILTIIGFLITILTFLKVINNSKEIKELNKKNFFINRLPENLHDLKKSSSKLSVLISQTDNNKKEILIEISGLSPILKSIKRSLKKEDLEHYNLLKEEVDKHKKTYISIDDVAWIRKLTKNFNLLEEAYIDKTYRYLSTLITDIENMNKDYKKDLLK
ncbi:hypothetical protein [Chryseobacterium sp. JK1]|uniref:hypothetical protein n=1 Tax=Chryseobacterium sp. JK1 TaxID=874294 RepID=UPI003D684E4F